METTMKNTNQLIDILLGLVEAMYLVYEQDRRRSVGKHGCSSCLVDDITDILQIGRAHV